MPLESIGSLMGKGRPRWLRGGLFRELEHRVASGSDRRGRADSLAHHRRLQRRILERAADRLAREQLTWYAGLGRAAAQSASVPCGFLFNECPSDDWVRLAITSGFNLVMPADSAVAFDRYVERVTALTSLAHAHGVAVEAEVGELPADVAGHGTGGGSLTDPARGWRICRRHRNRPARRERRECARQGCWFPGAGPPPPGSDPSSASRSRWSSTAERASPPIRSAQAIALGVAKVNYGTYLKQRYLRAVRGRSTGSASTRTWSSAWGADDLLVAGRRAVRDAVLERIELLGCCGRAD